MTNRIQRGDLQVSDELDKLISEKVCVNIDVEPKQFWNSFNEVVKEFTPRNKESYLSPEANSFLSNSKYGFVWQLIIIIENKIKSNILFTF